jgi:hypothetical protein
MRNYSWIGLLGLPVGILLGKIPGYLGFSCDIPCNAGITFAFLLIFVLLVYYLIPLKNPKDARVGLCQTTEDPED